MAGSLGERVRRLRSDQGWTLAQVATRCDLSVSYLNDIEHNRTVPSLGKLQAIAEAFDLDVRELLLGVAPYDSTA